MKNRIERELAGFGKFIDRNYPIREASPLLFKEIKAFMRRKGKRLRPILFCVGYLGFAKKKAAGLYTSALSIELLHDFLIIHDDIIDKADLRRGEPSMHKKFEGYLLNKRGVKFNGQDLSLVLGDVMYAMAVHAFLAIKEAPKRKEAALKNFIKVTIYTGTGEFVELINGIEDLSSIAKKSIYRVYDL